ncbi:hypothetical protein UlMin_014291 [Ulmus minor]
MNLKRLTLRGYGGLRLSSWLQSLSFLCILACKGDGYHSSYILTSKSYQMEEERIEAEKLWAQQLALIFDNVGAFKVKHKGGKRKLIFGSVTAQDLVDIIKDVDKQIVSLPDIRETGEYVVELKLHLDVTARVRVIVYAN